MPLPTTLITDEAIAAGLFEATHHMTGRSTWFKATIVKVTANFVDATIEGRGPRPNRYRRSDGEQRGDYCGFKSTLRPVTTT